MMFAINEWVIVIYRQDKGSLSSLIMTDVMSQRIIIKLVGLKSGYIFTPIYQPDCSSDLSQTFQSRK